MRLRLSLDPVNIFHSATPDTLVNNRSQVKYREYLAFVEPRRAQVGIRFEFQRLPSPGRRDGTRVR
jgi:hypothetical protein